MLGGMQIEDLRRLLALADHERVTDAAATLQMSQPTLSRLLARVEEELGTRLFERDARGGRPNPYGEGVLAAAKDITDPNDHLLCESAGLRPPRPGSLPLAILDSLASTL